MREAEALIIDFCTAVRGKDPFTDPVQRDALLQRAQRYLVRASRKQPPTLVFNAQAQATSQRPQDPA